MNDDLLDLGKAVSIVVNGEEVVNKVFERRMREMFEVADIFGEFGRLFPSQYRGVVKTAVPAATDDKPEGDGEKKDGEKPDGDEEGGDKESGDKEGGDK
jgi:hypothetical protein